MAHAARLNLRMQKEMKLLVNDPPPGVTFPFLSDEHNTFSSISTVEARLRGPEGSVYCDGLFILKIQIPERYPFQPPIVTFATPIYHPNIDNGGRICLDILNLPPKGAWQPSLNISTVLTSIGLLLSEPNPDDGLMAEPSNEYKYNRKVFDEKALYWTQRYANPLAAEKEADRATFPNLNMEPKQPLTLPSNPQPEVDETVGSRKKLRLMGGKLSLKSAASFRESSSEGIETSALNQLPSDASGRNVDHKNQASSSSRTDLISMGVSSSAVHEKGLIPVDLTTMIVLDSDESDNEADRPYKSRRKSNI